MTFRLPSPSRCSLLQGALWIARHEKPIPDHVFASAPISLKESETGGEGPLRPFLQALSAASLPAWADLVLLVRQSDDESWKARKKIRALPVHPCLWQWDNVNWERSAIKDAERYYSRYDDDMDEHVSRELATLEVIKSELDEGFWPTSRWFRMIDVKVDTVELIRLFPASRSDPRLEPPAAARPNESPYMQFLNSASEEIGITADNRITKKEVVELLRRLWREELGEFTNSKANAMATILRYPEHGKGGNLSSSRKGSTRLPSKNVR